MFTARVGRVLLASPSDTGTARDTLRRAIEDWSSVNSEATGVVLMPLLWERDSTPEMGDRPQAIINKQLGAKADVVIGAFWTRLGTPTGEAESGSAEEVREAIAAEKPVLLYFSRTPVVPDNLDPEQWEKLKVFRAEVEGKGLVDTYETTDELYQKVNAALTRTVRDRFGGSEPAQQPTSRASLVARVETEPTIRTSGSGITQSTNYFLVIENTGTAVAEDVRFELHAAGNVGDRELPSVLDADGPIARLAPNAPMRFHLVLFMGVISQCEIVLTWREGDTEHTETLTLRLY